MKKRVLLFLVTAIVACAGVVGSTVAWLFSKAFIKNTFVLGDITISLTESTGDNYKLIPGTVIPKDPRVTVKLGSEPCWVFIKIDESLDAGKYVSYEIADGWTKLEDGVYYIEYAIYPSDVTYSVLKNDVVNIKDTVTEADEKYLKDNGIFPKLTFTAYAIQFMGFENVSDAWQEAKKH